MWIRYGPIPTGSFFFVIHSNKAINSRFAGWVGSVVRGFRGCSPRNPEDTPRTFERRKEVV